MGANCCSLKKNPGHKKLNDGDSHSKRIVRKKDQKSTVLRRKTVDVSGGQLLSPHTLYKKQPEPSATERFEDTQFPSNTKSICFVDETNPASKYIIYEDEVKPLENVEWKPAAEIFGNNDFKLYEKLEIDDINQGQLGNCYFLSAISALAEFADRFNEIFCNKNEVKPYFAVQMYIQGKPKTVFVNDEFPCTEGGNFIFSHADNNELWVQVLEKAWAKLNQSYCMTIAGLPSEALDSLTMAPTMNCIHKKYSPEKLWEMISECDKANYIMCTSCEGSEEQAQDNGLVSGHAYSLIEARQYSKDPSVKLIKLRNPWGSYEWKGEYSDKNDKWTDDMKEEYKLVENTEDGEFWIHFDEFLKFFSYTFIAKFHSDYAYMAKKFVQQTKDSFCCTKFTVDKPDTHVYLGLHQKQVRFYRKVKGYTTQMARIILAKYNPQTREYTFIGSDSSRNEKLYVDAVLDEGEYHVFSKVNWPYEEKCSVVLSCYSRETIEFEAMTPEQVADNYIGETLEDYTAKHGTKIDLNSDVALQHCLGDTDTGYFLVNFVNQSNSQAYEVTFNCTINESVKILNIPGVRAESSDGANYKISVSLNPKEDNIALFELQDHPWKCKVSGLGQFEAKRIGKQNNTSLRGLIADTAKDFAAECSKINAELSYKVTETDDSVVLVFLNQGTSPYKVNLTFSSLINMKVDPTTPAEFLIKPEKNNHVRLLFNPNEEEFAYDFQCKYTKA